MAIIPLLAAAIAAAAPLLYACLGALLCERSGVVNLGIEGLMLAGALGGVAASLWSGSAPIGLLAAAAAGGLLSLIHALLTVTLRANQVLSGLALALFAGGLAALLGQPLAGGPAPAGFPAIPLPWLAELPGAGPVLFRQNALTYGAYLLPPLLWLWVFRTRAGLRLRAAGERPAAADALGVDVSRLRRRYVVAGGMLAGVAGAALALGADPGWAENIAGGRGWIAVALVTAAAWSPLRAAAGACLFGALAALLAQLQADGAGLPPSLLAAAPHLCAIAALALASRGARKSPAAPAALGAPFFREDRP